MCPENYSLWSVKCVGSLSHVTLLRSIKKQTILLEARNKLWDIEAFSVWNGNFWRLNVSHYLCSLHNTNKVVVVLLYNYGKLWLFHEKAYISSTQRLYVTVIPKATFLAISPLHTEKTVCVRSETQCSCPHCGWLRLLVSKYKVPCC